jgi:glyoxylase-like metal-dependent hydrolase (beta-lactamase superfamily II)
MTVAAIHPVRISFCVPLSASQTVERFAYVYVVEGESVCLVDTGVAGAETRLGSELAGMGWSLADVATIVLTHSHPDHIGAAAAVRQASGAAVWAYRGERDWIEDTDRQARERPVPGFAGLVGGPVRIDRFLEDGDRVILGDAGEFEVWHTPGHSPGSLSLVSRERGVVFCGDVIPQAGAMPIYDDVVGLARSLRRLQGIGELGTLFSSWAEPVHGEAARAAIRDGLAYLARVHDVACGSGGGDPMEVCRQCVAALGLPPFAANPLVARSMLAHREAGGRLLPILEDM